MRFTMGLRTRSNLEPEAPASEFRLCDAVCCVSDADDADGPDKHVPGDVRCAHASPAARFDGVLARSLGNDPDGMLRGGW